MADNRIRVEVCYAQANEPLNVALEVAAGTSLRQAIQQSGLLPRHPEIDLAINAVGIFGRVRGLDELVSDGDRVEIYRPLSIDPKEARRRAARKRV